jgi:K+-transporting ATPase ATPase C chain
MPHRAGGSLVVAGDRLLGSELLGQDFREARWFHPRPSATSGPDPEKPGSTLSQPYNAAASGASNLGPTSATLLEAVRERVAEFGAAPVPADAATASGSGLDPHISPRNAQGQVARVAAARGLPPERVAPLVLEHIKSRELGLLGAPRVNVLRLNMALDALR